MEDLDLHFGEKVNLPRRYRADLVDGAIASGIMVVPMLVGHAVADLLPDFILRLSGIGLPLGFVYVLFRDAVSGGTSLGKRALGLRLIRLEDGAPCTRGRVWARDLLDIIPFVNFIDFVGTCRDQYGQKEMDKRLGIQLVEVPQADGTSA
jgi:uncharacterized RDD family membrane protein YckC